MPNTLVHTLTSDGLRLDGALDVPESSAASLSVDALVCLHGVGSNFYSSMLLGGIAPLLVDAGIAVLRANTRGRDSVYLTGTPDGLKRMGAAYERVADCVFDIRGWVDFLAEQGYQRIGLMGHSLGAIKAIFSAAKRPDPRIACIAAVSPPRLCYSRFSQGGGEPRLEESMTRAEQAVASGRADELLEVNFPFPMLMTAAGYIEKYGRDEKYDIVQFIENVGIPCLVTYGSRELEHGGAAFQGIDSQLQGVPDPRGLRRVVVIDAADHNYVRRHSQLATSILQWLQNDVGK